MMNIIVNGEALRMADGATLAQLVEQLDIAGKRIAVEINEEIVPRSRYANIVLHDGDCVEIVQAIGGG